MRWLVEVTSIDKTDSQSVAVEAESWQRALQSARAQRGESGPISGFSIELLDDGYRAVDPMARLRYVVKRSRTEDAVVAPQAPPRPSPAGAGAGASGAGAAAAIVVMPVKKLPPVVATSPAAKAGPSFGKQTLMGGMAAPAPSLANGPVATDGAEETLRTEALSLSDATSVTEVGPAPVVPVPPVPPPPVASVPPPPPPPLTPQPALTTAATAHAAATERAGAADAGHLQARARSDGPHAAHVPRVRLRRRARHRRGLGRAPSPLAAGEREDVRAPRAAR